MKKHLGIRVLLAAAVSLPVLAFAAPAQASVTGKYQCYQFDPYSGYLYTGWYNLKSSGSYTVGSGTGGHYAYHADTHKLVFKTGSMKYAFGKKVSSSKFNMYFKSDGSKYGYCTKS